MRLTNASDVSESALYRGFIKAFSEYKVPFLISPEDFIIRFNHKLNVYKNLSVIALDQQDEVEGFIFHTLNNYKEIPTLYNGGTGVISDKRNSGLGVKMYEYIMPELLNTIADRIILEVVTTNDPALALYRKLGFTYLRTFKCFKAKKFRAKHSNQEVVIMRNTDWDPDSYLDFQDFEASFIDNNQQVGFNIKNEMLLEAFLHNQCVGYAIFQPRLGRITQMGVHRKHRGQGVGSRLMQEMHTYSEKKEMTILNIPEEAEDLILFLEGQGFVNEIDQYEMELSLRS